jgi:hypothetical protein
MPELIAIQIGAGMILEIRDRFAQERFADLRVALLAVEFKNMVDDDQRVRMAQTEHFPGQRLTIQRIRLAKAAELPIGKGKIAHVDNGIGAIEHRLSALDCEHLLEKRLRFGELAAREVERAKEKTRADAQTSLTGDSDCSIACAQGAFTSSWLE